MAVLCTTVEPLKTLRFAIGSVDRYDCLLKDLTEKGSNNYEITRWI